MKKKIVGILAACFFVLNANCQEVSFSGDLSFTSGAYTPGTENSGDLSIGNLEFIGSVKASEGNGTVFVEGDFTNDYLTKENSYGFTEAYIDYSSSFWGIRIGQQKIVWGKADEIEVTDSVFPKDMTSLFKDDDSVAVKAARLSLSGNLFTLDALVIPFFTGSKLPLEEKNSLRSYVVPKTVSLSQGANKIELPVNVVNPTEPELKLKNMEYGIKASGYFPFCDVSLYGFYGWDKLPVFNYRVVPESLAVSGEYKRLSMFGIDFAKPIGSTVIRSETAFFPGREIQSSSKAIMNGKGNSIKHNEIKTLAGIDWMPDSWTITAQYFADYLFEKADETERTDSYEHGATLSVSKSFLSETLELSLSGVVDFNDYDSAVNGSIKYDLTDQMKFSMGTYIFVPGPDKDGKYGKYKDLNCAYLKMQYKW